MINALASVPLVIWGLESSWTSGRWRGSSGGLALACQVFAGHLQDAVLTISLVGLYGLYRAATEHGPAAGVRSLGMAIVLVGLGVLISGVQWVPSKELLDRSPRRRALVAKADLWIMGPRAVADGGGPRSLRHPRATPTGWTDLIHIMK